MSVTLGIIAICGIFYLNFLECVTLHNRRRSRRQTSTSGRLSSSQLVESSGSGDNSDRSRDDTVAYSSLELLHTNKIYEQIYEQSPLGRPPKQNLRPFEGSLLIAARAPTPLPGNNGGSTSGGNDYGYSVDEESETKPLCSSFSETATMPRTYGSTT
jgi:hypothetical protein